MFGLIGLYLGVGLLTALITAAILRFFKVRSKQSYWLSISVVILSLGLVNILGIPYYQAWVFESDVKKNTPLFALLAEKSPADFKQYVVRVKKDIIHNHSRNVISLTSEFVNSEVMKCAVFSSNEALYNQAESTVRYYKTLYEMNPTLVLASEFPNRFNDTNINRLLVNASKKQIKNLLHAKENIIRSALRSPQSPLSKNDLAHAQFLLNGIFDRLTKKYGAQSVEMTFQQPDNASLDKKQAAEIIIQFYQSLLSQDKKGAGIIIKYIAGLSG
ncbi:hypothetical protein [Legionella spiritensis]|uniref:hypothetical protein n=1 Tax=Legionella spiritensis TaxID=452 RepID=UPI000F6E4D3A|nr:hypothetical protein [Legionella spiritensis]VEG90485.1 Uncharacterised protein [Legionella spiritensis]